ncbi:MAG: hypothetical protein KDI13_00220 [Alphaproteobacteria bacterium]|nr:hypothetical protein [Alphaproteobacteria bacterium]
MTHKTSPGDNIQNAGHLVPFDNVEEAWFWFIAAQGARNDGARFVAGMGRMPRPCEPLDILKTLDRLHRNRVLKMDHLLVLRHYGRRNMPPDPRRIKEMHAYRLWREAMERLEPPLQKKGIVRSSSWASHIYGIAAE